MDIKDADIVAFLEKQNLDIRKRGKNSFSRFLDQKVTPDVMWVIADTIFNLTNGNDNDSFTTKDIWKNPSLETKVTGYFNKPSVNNPKVKNEFDKFIGQVINTLNFAGVISKINSEKKGIFKVENIEMLSYIAASTHNALVFLEYYIEAVLKKSGLWSKFDNFLMNNEKDEFELLKAEFELFLKRNTNITDGNSYEAGRIFAKVLNPIAYKYKKFGTTKGLIAKELKSFSDLQYNAKNWAYLNKLKNIPRKEFVQHLKADIAVNKQIKQWANDAKEAVKKLHFPKSEVNDKYSNAKAMDPHHIFPVNSFPDLSYFRENIILLTPTQHYNFAHPNRNTRIIDIAYQKLCVMSKIESVEHYEKIGFYSKSKLVKVINQGYGVNIKEQINYIDLRKEVKNIS